MTTLKTEAGEYPEQHDDGLLSRWAKRKQAVLQETRALQASQELQEQEPLAAGSRSVEEPIEPADEDMPPIELLTADSDYSGFMSPKVSEQLRRLALRKLFHGADFNICDGLDDYDDDYTSFAKLGSIVTADMKHQIELELRKKLEETAASDDVESEAINEAETNAEQTLYAEHTGEPAGESFGKPLAGQNDGLSDRSDSEVAG